MKVTRYKMQGYYMVYDPVTASVESRACAIEVELEILVAENKAQAFLDALTDLTSGTVEGLETGKEYRAFPVE